MHTRSWLAIPLSLAACTDPGTLTDTGPLADAFEVLAINVDGGESTVAVLHTVEVTVSAPLGEVDDAALRLVDAYGFDVPGSLTVDDTGHTLFLDPDWALRHGHDYVLELDALVSGDGDVSEPETRSFTTAHNLVQRTDTFGNASKADELTAWSDHTYDDRGRELERHDYDDPGPDSTWATPDDGHSRWSRWTYDDEARIYEIEGFNDPGTDGIWVTPDDVRTSWFRFSVDEWGNQLMRLTLGPDGTATGRLDFTPGERGWTTQQIIFDKEGGDGVWGTADDAIGGITTFAHDAAGAVTQSVVLTGRGEDGVWGTEDDEVARYSAGDFLDDVQRDWVSYNSPGVDGVWFTKDDGFFRYLFETRTEDGLPVLDQHVLDPGPDGIWFTSDDAASSYTERAYDDAGNRVTWTRYNGVGADGVWRSADDHAVHVSHYETR